MQSEYLVCEFAKETLSNLVRERFGTEFPDINDKVQVKYLFNYLKDLKAQTILLESDYVDRDYLEDYSRYYVKCFNRYFPCKIHPDMRADLMLSFLNMIPYL